MNYFYPKALIDSNVYYFSIIFLKGIQYLNHFLFPTDFIDQ